MRRSSRVRRVGRAHRCFVAALLLQTVWASVAGAQWSAPEIRLLVESPDARTIAQPPPTRIHIINASWFPAVNTQLTMRPSGSGRFGVGPHAHWSQDRWTWDIGQMAPWSVRTVNVQVPNTTKPLDVHVVATALGMEACLGLGPVRLEVADQVDPLQVGAVARYNVRVWQSHCRTPWKLSLQVDPRAALVEVLGPDGPRAPNREQNVVLDRTPALYQVLVQYPEEGNFRFAVTLKSCLGLTPVTESEMTRVLAP